MGRRGPKPLTAGLLRLRGSRLASGRARAQAPAKPGRPTCPAFLDARARRCWRRLVPLLAEQGTLALVDRNGLARYCRLWSRYQGLEEVIMKKGETYEARDRKGRVLYVTDRPEVRIIATLVPQLRGLEADLGLSAAARTNLKVGKAEADSAPTGKARFFA